MLNYGLYSKEISYNSLMIVYSFCQSLALMGGMITSTVLTLYLIPMIYRWVEE